MRRIVVSLCLVLVGAMSAGQPPEPTPSPAPDPTAATVVLKVPGMERVRVRRDVVYAKVDGKELAADVYLPPAVGKGGKPPVVVLQAGGAENTKDWGIYTSLGRLLAASGLAAVPFNHRLRYPRRQYQEGAADLAALLELLRREGSSLGLDGGRVAVAVFSGGGPMLAPLLRDRPVEVRCLAAFYAFLDTEHVNLAEAGINSEIARRYSPLAQLEARPSGLPPLFIARAGRDAIPGVNASIDRFAAVALSHNVPIALVNHPAGSHGFDHREDDARTREVLEMAIAFFRANLGAAGASPPGTSP
jgi:acetyl esterase/lipase